MDIPAKKKELSQLRDQVRRLEDELLQAEPAQQWQPPKYYPAYHATTGFLLGIFGAAASLLVNVIGAPIVGKNPLELIRIYLTFPLGAQALDLSNSWQNTFVIDDGVILAIGCCLYLATGMLLGVPFYLVLTWLTQSTTLGRRLAVATVLSLALWGINFYGILSWLQPLLFGGNWIVDNSLLPWWVAAVTHLVFGWTMALLYPLGQFTPYVSPVEKA